MALLVNQVSFSTDNSSDSGKFTHAHKKNRMKITTKLIFLILHHLYLLNLNKLQQMTNQLIIFLPLPGG